MNSEKVKEIKKALDICKRANIETCRECPYNYTQTKTKSLCHKMAEHALTYINELESENERLRLERDVLIGKKIVEKQKHDKAIIMKIDIQKQLKNRIVELEKKIENGTLVELGYHIRKSYRNHDDQRYKIILIDEVEIDKIGYDGLTKAEAEARLKELQEEQK